MMNNIFQSHSRFNIFLNLDLYDIMTLQILCQLSKVQFSDHLTYSERKNNLKNSIGFFLKHKFCFCTFQLLLENMAEQKYWFRNVIQSSLYLKVLVSRSLKLNIRLKYCSWVSCLLSISSQFPIPFKVPGGHRGGLAVVVVTSAKPAVDNKVSGSHSRQT